MPPVSAAAGSRDGAAHQKVTPYAWFVLGVLCLVYIFNFLDRQLMGTLTPFIEKDMGLTDAQLGNLGGLYFALFYTVIGVPVGWLADRVNRVRLLSAGCFLWSLATGSCGVSANYGQLAMSRMAVGIGEAAGSPPSYSIVSDYFPPMKRGTALALFSLGVPLGQAAGTAFGVPIADHFGWRLAFKCLAAVGVLASIILVTLVREPKRGGKDDTVVPKLAEEAPAEGLDLSRARFWPNLVEFFTRPVLIFTALGCGFAAMVGYSQLTFTTKLLIGVPSQGIMGQHMTPGEVALWYALILAVPGSIGLWLAGWLVDVLGRRRTYYYGLVPAIGTFIVIPLYWGFVQATDWHSGVLYLIGPIFLNTFYLAPALAVVQNRVRPNQRTQASAMLLFVLNLVGLGAGPTLVGHLSTQVYEPVVGKATALQHAMMAIWPIYLLAVACMLLEAWALWREDKLGTGGIRH